MEKNVAPYYRIIQLPCPLELNTLVVCHLLMRNGMIDNKTFVRLDWRTLAFKQLDLAKESYILYVTPLFVSENVGRLLSRETTVRQEKIRSLVRTPNKVLSQLIRCFSLTNNGREIVEQFNIAMERYLETGDNFSDLIQQQKLPIPKIEPGSLEDRETRVIMVPNDKQLFSRESEVSMVEVNPADPVPSLLPINEKIVKNLLGQVFIILVAGPPRSGKSTVVVSLNYACAVLAKSIMNAHFWPRRHHILTKFINADRATPVSPFIKTGEISELLHLPKHPWTTDMAWDVVDTIMEQKQNISANMIKFLFIDVPGGKDGNVTDIIKIIAATADAAILLFNSTAGIPVIDQWKKLFTEMGIVQLAQIETYLAEDSGLHQSVMTHIGERGKVMVEGKIRLMARKFQPWDPVIDFLAHYIICRAIPQMIIDRNTLVSS